MTHNDTEYRQARIRHKLLVALLVATLLAGGAPAIPVLGGPGHANATQASGGGGGP